MTSPARVSPIASTTGLGALALHAAVRGEPGLAAIGALSLGWGTLVTAGVILPWLEMYGRVVSRGPPGSARDQEDDDLGDVKEIMLDMHHRTRTG